MPVPLLASVLVIAIVANGLLAGLFFAFSVAVAPGLRQVDEVSHVQAFRAINSAILNRTFLAVFFAAPIAAAGCLVLQFWRDGPASSVAVAAGAFCSLLTFGITAARNVPLNQELDRARLDTEDDHRIARHRFEGPWNRWNHARTITSIAAVTLLAASLATG